MTGTAACRTFALTDRTGIAVPIVVVMYPTGVDGLIAPGTFPLVVFSHGNGGSGMLYRTLAEKIAERGYIVALPDHPGNNRTDNDLARTIENLEQQPRHIRRVADWAFGESPFAASLKRDTLVIVGHSMGGYTALAAAGGRPTAFPHETPEHQSRLVDIMADQRVKALVLLAPATAWFEGRDALSRVRVPILMLTAEHDDSTPPFHAQIVERGVALLEQRVIPNAGHFAFLDPFPQMLTKPSFPPSQDPPGFDRASVLAELGPEIAAFLDRVLDPAVRRRVGAAMS